jgi:HlyD family secretion protein
MISLIPLPIASQARGRRFVQCAQVAVLLSSPWLISCHGPVGDGTRTKHGFAVNADEHLAATLERGLRLSGTTVASHSFVVMAPQLEGAQLSTMLITEIVPAGTAVKAGEVLVRFDPQAQMKDYLEKRDKFAELEGQVAQKRAEEDIAAAKDETSLREAENAQRKAQLEVQKNELVSKIDAEKNDETLEEARTAAQQLGETFQLKRKSAAAGIRILELQRDGAREAMQYAESNAAKMTIKSPMDGIAVLNSIWIGSRMGTVQPGDQVNPGTSFMQVVDPSKMEVRVRIPQPDLGRVHIGDRAAVRPDAYPDIVMPATLEQVSPLGQEGNFSDKIRLFTATFAVEGSDPKLLPDLSVAIDVDPKASSGRPAESVSP